MLATRNVVMTLIVVVHKTISSLHNYYFLLLLLFVFHSTNSVRYSQLVKIMTLDISIFGFLVINAFSYYVDDDGNIPVTDSASTDHRCSVTVSLVAAVRSRFINGISSSSSGL